jgi:hypothetical protein
MIGRIPYVRPATLHITIENLYPHSVLYFPCFHIREYSLDHGISGLLINPLYGFSSMSYMSLQFAIWEAVHTGF